MKIKYYFMSMMVAALAVTGFTSCSDDDNDEPSAPSAGDDKVELVLPSEAVKVKIGEENRLVLPVTSGGGEYHAYTLDPTIVGVVEGEDGNIYLEGYKNGTGYVVVSDAAGNYKRMLVSVYTTDVMELSHTEFQFDITLGFSATNRECKVVLGNGDYKIESDNRKVAATIDSETGEITLSATAGAEAYVAHLTVSDISGLTATIEVTVTPLMEGFSSSDIQEILAKTENTLYGACKDPSDGTYPYYWGFYKDRGTWTDSATDGVYTLGWWYFYNSWGSTYDYGGLKMEWPDGTAVDTEVAGKLYYQYSNKSWYDCYEYEGTVKVLEDNATRIVALFWQVDLDNERINRAYIIHYK